jgi:hypothetical protein
MKRERSSAPSPRCRAEEHATGRQPEVLQSEQSLSETSEEIPDRLFSLAWQGEGKWKRSSGGPRDREDKGKSGGQGGAERGPMVRDMINTYRKATAGTEPEKQLGLGAPSIW